MKCPDCNADLVQAKRDGVEMEVCPSCAGMWLTPQELTQLEDEVFDFGDDEKGSLMFEPSPDSRKCPECGKAMMRFQYRLYDLDMDYCETTARLLAGSRRGQARSAAHERRRTQSRPQSSRRRQVRRASALSALGLFHGSASRSGDGGDGSENEVSRGLIPTRALKTYIFCISEMEGMRSEDL